MNKKIKTLLIGSNIWYLGEGMLGPLFAVFANKIGGNILDITWAWATYLIISGTLVIVVGTVADRMDRGKIMVTGYALNALFTFCYLLVQTPFHLFLVQAGLGLASALAIPTWNALYDISEKDKGKKSYVWGMASGQLQIVTGVAIIFGGLIVSNYSFNVLFITMGTIQVIATIYQARILKLV
jgi:MFS family permease